MSSNNAIIFLKPPTEYPVEGEHLKFEKRPYSFPEPKDGQIILENIYSSIDPYMRGRMRAPELKSYSPPFPANEPIRSINVSRVYKSANDKFKVGDLVFNRGGEWSEYSFFPASVAEDFNVIDNKYKIPLSNFCGAVGMPGLTAYSSYYEIGNPKKGETIFISAASGAVGQLVGQLAKKDGLYVVGSAGTDAKVKYLKEIGFDAAFNYKTEDPFKALPKYCPKGIDIYYENVGGVTLEAVLGNANDFGRIIACGMISQYNTKDYYGVKGLMLVVAKRLLIRGFIVGDKDFGPKYQAEFAENMPKWLASGEIKYQEDIADGLEAAPAKFIGMLKGENFGKTMVRIGKE